MHLYTLWDMTSLKCSLFHSNNNLAGNYVIRGLRPKLDWEAGQLWLLKIEWEPGDTFNQHKSLNRVKGAHVVGKRELTVVQGALAA